MEFIAAKNVGKEAIPAWGVVEYDDSLFPDKLNKYARPVLSVRRPRADNVATFAINGPVAIGPGRQGRVTQQYPTYVLYEYSTDPAMVPECGQSWGPQKDSFRIKKGNRGLIIMGGAAGIGTAATVRVERAIAGTGVRFLNSSGEKCPKYGVCRVTAYAGGGDPYYTITKPDTTFDRLYLVNGAADVEDGKYGYGFFEGELDVLYNSGSGTPAIRESWGPKPGQWTLEKNWYGFTIEGGVDTTLGNVRCHQHEVNEVIGKTDASHAKSASGTVSVWAGALGSEADTTINVTAYNRFAAVGSAKWVGMKWIGGGWDLTAAEC